MDGATAIAIIGTLVLLVGGFAMLLSYIDSAMRGDLDSFDYYCSRPTNPLKELNSKYFHYRPQGSVLLTEAQWSQIQGAIHNHISEVRRSSIATGRRLMLKEIKAKLQEEKSAFEPSNPYEVLGLSENCSEKELSERYYYLLELYDPRNFVDLDSSFIELAKIRREQLKSAFNKIGSPRPLSAKLGKT